MSDPKGECPVDIQANEPQSGRGSKGKRSRPNREIIVLSLLKP